MCPLCSFVPPKGHICTKLGHLSPNLVQRTILVTADLKLSDSNCFQEDKWGPEVLDCFSLT